ncbi:MAG: response regulator transcription factor [Verrucomicrobiota bacterium]
MRILLVEDNRELSASLKRHLILEGYEVVIARDGEEGLYYARNWPFDLVTLDVMLPRLDGWDVLRTLRRETSLPVLMLTARDGVDDRVKGLDGGADDYLVKPFDIAEFLARIRAVVRRAYAYGGDPIAIGDLSIDLEARSVLRDGRPVALTPTEYILLEGMALRRGKPVATSSLVDRIEDGGREINPSSIEYHIHNLRKKLGREVIETVRGFGYRLP